jgi:hypothetical protein
MKTFVLLLEISLCITIISCRSNNRISKNELVGLYAFNQMSDSIELRSNNTYYHYYTTVDNKKYENTGFWNFNLEHNEIIFQNFSFFNESGTDGLPKGSWISRINNSNGKLKLMYSSENNIYYVKTNNIVNE